MYMDPYSVPISGLHHFPNASIALNGSIENQSPDTGSMSIEDSISNSSLFDDRDLNMTSEETYIFDRTDVRVIFITLHTLVFCCCFFGNLLVILVVTLSRRLRSITNFFLANLAVADFCVGIFCVFQNLSIYLIHSWVLGDFLCKMSQFVHSMSYTASIFILVVICTERYFAIIHPITCKQILTPTRLRLVIAAVWITSALYSAPKLIWVQIITNPLPDGRKETICIPHRKKYNSELFDMINFALLYVTPLCVMTILYTRIAVGLWRSSRGLERHMALTAVNNGNCNNGTICRRASSRHEKRNVTVAVETRVNKPDKTSPTGATPAEGTSSCRPRPRANSYNQGHARQSYHMSHSSQNVLRARRGVIRMLIIVVLTFAICNLPFHARKMWQYWSTDYQGDSNFSTLFTPLTFLITYFNSGVNPLLYAFLSRNFRKGMRELLLCSFRGSKKKKSKQSLLNPHALQQPQSSILRVSSTRSNTTKAINCSTTLTMGDGLKS